MEFRQPTEVTPVSNQLPSVAMNFNGKYLENEIEGYRTLKVSGRETISQELISENTHEGTITIDDRLPHRVITITYALKTKNNTEFQNKFKKMRKMLTSNGEVQVTFRDEPNTVYHGQLGTMEVPPDDSNSIVSTFQIYCDNPYKQSAVVVTDGGVTIDTFYETLPERIVLDITETTNNIEVTNGIERITATGTFNAGSEVVIKFEKEEVSMTVNDVESTYMIDLQSDLENFLLRQGGTITSPQGDITLEMRERWL